MRRHLYALSVVMILLATGCGNSAVSESSSTEDAISSVSEATEEVTENNNPTFTISSNNVGSTDSGGNFYLIADYGNSGRAEYDMQFDNNGKYVGTFVYSYLAGGEVIDDFILKAGIPVDVTDITCISEDMYFCFLVDNGLDGFDKSLEQTAMYEKFCEQYGLKAPDVSLEGTGLYLLAEPSSYSIVVGETTAVNIKHAPDEYEGSYTYTSSEPLIATVDDSGLITGMHEGETTISVVTEDGNHSCQFVITVT